MDIIAELQKINKLRDDGEISADEAEQRKYKLMELVEVEDRVVEFDKGCST